MFEQIIKNVEKKPPLIHCITNYVTVNDCANILLACGASPVMADDVKEVEEITSISDGLVINIGTLNERTVQSMIKAGRASNRLGHSVILDPVGIGASALRTDTAFKLLNQIDFSVIRGNISEIKALSQGSGKTKGVDADIADKITDESLFSTISFVKALSAKTNSIIVVTGPIDVVSDSKKTYIIRNGHPLMSKVSGTGCMLTCVIGAFCAANPDNVLGASAAAVCAMGLCGELGFDKINKEDGGTSSYRTYIIDFMSKISSVMQQGNIKIEVR